MSIERAHILATLLLVVCACAADEVAAPPMKRAVDGPVIGLPSGPFSTAGSSSVGAAGSGMSLTPTTSPVQQPVAPQPPASGTQMPAPAAAMPPPTPTMPAPP